jgi:succinate dehydrogenase / fumarate reductase iron-sulfur subunit
MKVTFRIRRYLPETRPEPWYQEYEVEVDEGTVVLYALHEVRDRQDPTLAYRYSCRGAICGSCAMRINGTAALACKTQVSDAAEADGGVVTLEPLANLEIIKDLVVEQEPFFEEMLPSYPWLVAENPPDADAAIDYGAEMSSSELDEWDRAANCIKCQACLSDCPARAEKPGFVGPAACVEIYKHALDPRDDERARRIEESAAPGGIWDCERHANCVKVCSKDCRPMRAIMMLRRRAGPKEGSED